MSGYVCASCWLITLASAAACVVVYFWDTARMGALLGVTAVFAAAALLVAWRMLRALRDKPRFMAATVAELEKDREQLGPST